MDNKKKENINQVFYKSRYESRKLSTRVKSKNGFPRGIHDSIVKISAKSLIYAINRSMIIHTLDPYRWQHLRWRRRLNRSNHAFWICQMESFFDHRQFYIFSLLFFFSYLWFSVANVKCVCRVILWGYGLLNLFYQLPFLMSSVAWDMGTGIFGTSFFFNDQHRYLILLLNIVD